MAVGVNEIFPVDQISSPLFDCKLPQEEETIFTYIIKKLIFKSRNT